MTVTINDPKIYTEFSHTVHGAQVRDAPLIEVDQVSGGPAWVRPETITAKYELRTHLGHTAWQARGVEVHGPWLTEDGEPDVRFTFAPKTGLLLTDDHTPGWARVFLAARFPRHLTPVVGGRRFPAPIPDAAGEPVGDSLISVTDVTSSTEIRHSVFSAGITGADPLVVPAHEPGRSDRWMRPEQITVTYLWRVGALSPFGWHVQDLSVVGPWVTEHGEPDENAGGSARWPGGTRPDWLAEFVTTHTPGEEDTAVLAAA